MKILCSLSSIEFSCDHIPGSYHHRDDYLTHPIFSLPQKRLLALTGKWAAGELTPTDSYLLFLALLRSSDLVEWRIPVMRSQDTDAIVANNLEALLRIIIKLPTISSYEEIFPHYAVSQDTRYLGNVKYWIQNWTDCYNDFKSGYKSAHESAIIIRRENALARLIKSPHLKPHEYAGRLAEWAVSAGSFPSFTLSPPAPAPFSHCITCADFWKEIIVRCTKDEFIFSIPDSDLQELITHCEENIPIGSIHSNALFAVLRKAATRKKTFLDLGEPDLRSGFRIIPSAPGESGRTFQGMTAEAANLQALIDSAPAEAPVREHYPSEFLFMKAKMRWQMATRYAPSSTATSATSVTSKPNLDI